MTDPKWVKRWKYSIAPKPVLPGVWRKEGGGFVVRGRALDPRTGKLRLVNRTVAVDEPAAALVVLQAELKKIREGAEPEKPTLRRFSDFAVSLLEKKIRLREIKSAKNRIQWASVLENHLIPAFGDYYVERIGEDVIEAWQAEIYEAIAAGDYSPHTTNSWLAVLRVILKAAKNRAIDDIKPFDTSEYEIYTEEEPNSLTIEELRLFLSKMREEYPQHFAMTALGFATGLRPSTLRPLRRKGPDPDLLMEQGLLRVRRSHTVHDEVMETTKTGIKPRIGIPGDLMDILRWHIEQLPEGPMQDSDLLFPSETGGYRSGGVLLHPFERVARLIGLSKHVTPRAMRRTFQDLARAAEMKDIVTRAISGHATEEMQRHYSTVQHDEMRAGLARVLTMAGFKEALDRGPSASNGAGGGGSGGAKPKTKKAG